MEDVDVEELENPNKDLQQGFILGDTGFAKWVTKTFLSSRNESKEIPQLKKLKSKVSIIDIIEAFCDEFHCDKEDILSKGRKRNIARDLSIYLARDTSGMSCEEFGKYFGGISGPGITMRYNKICSELAGNRKLGNKVKQIKNRIMINYMPLFMPRIMIN